MLLLIKPPKHQFLRVSQKLTLHVSIGFRSTYEMLYSTEVECEVERITKIINDHPFPDIPLYPTLLQQIAPAIVSTSFVENVLGRLFAAHSNGLKAFEFFKISLQNPQFRPSSDAFEKTLHILTRMRYFDKAWELMEEIHRTNPSLISLKSLSIILSRIAKFQSYEETIEAFWQMEKILYLKEFGTDEFNVLLQAFCTQRQMKEARSIFNKLYSRFSANTKTMNILLLGFKESGDVTSVELFYHEMVRRGFTPTTVTYNIRIDAYCKRSCFKDALRLFEEMEHKNCLPTLETITTLIYGAGIARDITKAKQLFNEIPMRDLVLDTGAYNALINSFIRSRDLKSATRLMDEMEEKGISHDSITYHTIFLALMRSDGMDGVSEFYEKMTQRKFVPKARTVVMLMKFFCQHCKVDQALDLWGYLIERGYCPPSHALNLLVTGLCSLGRVQEAFDCSTQMLERGRHVSEVAFLVLEKHLLEIGDEEKLNELDRMIKRLQNVVPTSYHGGHGHAIGVSSLST